MARPVKMNIAEALLMLVSEKSDDKAHQIYTVIAEGIESSMKVSQFGSDIKVPGRYKHLLIKA